MPKSKALVAIGLGSNLGARQEELVAAIGALAGVVTEIKVGGLYESEAMGDRDDPRYLNSALVGRTHLPSEPLLAVLKFLELKAGRRRGRRWGPRPLDLDLLLYGDEVATTPELTLPHSQLTRRPFVLAPLADVAPGLAVPPLGQTVAELLARLDTTGLERFDWSVPAYQAPPADCYPAPDPGDEG